MDSMKIYLVIIFVLIIFQIPMQLGQLSQQYRVNNSAQVDTSQQEINPLEVLFSKEEIKLSEFMSIDNLQKIIKQLPEGFSTKLLNHHQFIKDLMDCAMRTDKLQITQLQTSWPYFAAQFLSTQQEDFYKAFFSSSKSQQTQSDSGSRIEGSELLEWLFKILEQPKPINSTSAGYLLKIFSQIYYTNQQEFFWYFINNQEVLASCIIHLYNPSILEIVWRIVDTFNDDVDNKVSMVEKIIEGGLSKKLFLIQALQNIQTLIDNLIQRSEQINTKKLSIRLCRQIINASNIDLIRKLISSYEPQNLDRTVLRQCTILLNTYLKFFVQQKNPKKQVFTMQSSIQLVSITKQLLQQVALLIRHLFYLWFKSFEKQNKQQSKYLPFSLLHTFLKIEPSLAEQLIFEPFISLCIKVMKRQANNNILHNQIKGILQIAFTTNASKWIITVELLQFIIQSFQPLQTGSKSYLNQLFRISQMIQMHFPQSTLNKQIRNKWNLFIQKQFAVRKDLYSTPLAQSTRSKRDFFPGHQEVCSEEGQQFDGIIIMKKYSEDQIQDDSNKVRILSPPPELDQIEMSIPLNIEDLKQNEVKGKEEQQKELSNSQ